MEVFNKTFLSLAMEYNLSLQNNSYQVLYNTVEHIEDPDDDDHDHDHHHDHVHDDDDHHQHFHRDDEHDKLPIEVLTIVGLFLAVICLIGIIGNLLSAIVLFKIDMRSSTKYLLFGLTIFDTLLLTNYLVTFIFYAINPFDGVHSHDETIIWFYYIHTQFLFPILQTAYTGSVYSIVLITMERFIAVCKPFMVNRLLTRQSSRIALLLLFTFAVLLNFPRWFELMDIEYEEEVFNHKTNSTVIKITHDQLHHDLTYLYYYHGVIWIGFMFVIPFLILGIFNYCIWRQVKEANKKRANLTESKNAIRAEISITKMLLIVVCVFTTCNAINCVLIFIFAVLQSEHHAYIIGYLSATPLIINSSVNIIIYCLKGKAFRNQFVKLFKPYWTKLCCCCFCCNCNHVNNENSNKKKTNTSELIPTSSSASGQGQAGSNSGTSLIKDNQKMNKGSLKIPAVRFPSPNKIYSQSQPTIVYILKTRPSLEDECNNENAKYLSC